MIRSSVFAFFFLLALSSNAQDIQKKNAADKKDSKTLSPEQQEVVAEFKGTQFLQLDKLVIPKVLESIDDEIKQNVIDTILASKTHTQIFAQTRKEGYTSSYTKFFGLNVEIEEDLKDKNYFNLKLFYYNWTTNNSDKEIKRKIGKYNLLNELRFAIFELLNGSDYVKENYDKIQRMNYERIKSIREMIEENKKEESRSRKKKKIAEDDEEEREKEANARRLLKRKEKEKMLRPDMDYTNPFEEEIDYKSIVYSNSDIYDEFIKIQKKAKKKAVKNKVGDNFFILEEKDPEVEESFLAKKKEKREPLASKNTDFLAPENPTDEQLGLKPDRHLTLLRRNLALIYFNEYNKSQGLIDVETNIRFLGFSGEYQYEQNLPRPLGFRFGMKVGLPIFKDEYDFKMFKSAEVQAFKKKMFGFLDVYTGVHYYPIFAANVPTFGGGIQVFENNFVWLKAGIGINFHIKKRPVEIRTELLKTTFLMSNYLKDLSGHTLNAHIYAQITNKFFVNVSLSKSTLDGDLSIQSNHYQFGIGYNL